MRIVYIIPGPAGPFFEKNSLREQALVAELRWSGHDVLFVPVLFPLKADTPVALSAEAAPLLVGAVRLYARQTMPRLARLVPEWLWRRLDSPAMRKRVARRVLSSPRRFYEFMKEALDGRNGVLEEDIAQLCQWLGAHRKPDVVFLSTPFLLGIAAMVRKALRVPVACAMNSELDDIAHLRDTDGIILLTKLRSAVADADGFIPVSTFHSERIQRRLGIATSATRPVHPGIYADQFTQTRVPTAGAVGIVIRNGIAPAGITPANAISVLIKAKAADGHSIRVARDHFAPNSSHDAFDRRLMAETGVRVETLPRSNADLQTFLSTLDCVIFLHPDQPPAFDYMVLEALSCGVPALLPDCGANREIAGLSDAVFLYSDATDMGRKAAALRAMGRDDAETLRTTARSSVEHCFSMPRMAQETAEALQTIIARCSPPPDPWQIRPAQPATQG